VTATVGVQNGQLNEDQQTEDGQDQSGTIPVMATVTAVGPGTVTLTVNGVSVTLELPAGLTLPSSIVGQTVTINSRCRPRETTRETRGTREETATAVAAAAVAAAAAEP
jgi:hypothetical protein